MKDTYPKDISAAVRSKYIVKTSFESSDQLVY